MRKKLRLSPLQISLLHEFSEKSSLASPSLLANQIKALPVTLTGMNSITRAISSAGGVAFDNLDSNLMRLDRPGQFIAGEMLNWEAPTGGYLFQGVFATGAIAADGIANYLALEKD